MFILFISVLFLSIHHGQCVIQATANLQFHLTSISSGTLNFVQNDANSSVQITGTLSLLNASSSHVCLIKERNFYIIFFFQRVFMFMLTQSPKHHRIVQQLWVILILIVNNKNFLLLFLNLKKK
jgi:hypothetical protein